MRIPFDSLCLAAVMAELQPWIGAKAQKWLQMDANTLAVQLYQQGEAWLWLSWNAELPRIHLGPRPDTHAEVGPFVQAIRSRLHNTRLIRAEQVGVDRIFHLDFETPEGQFCLIGELMGKHTNVMLVDENSDVLTAAKWLGTSKSKRPILPGQPYSPPPLPTRRSLLAARSGDDLSEFEGLSPFLLDLLERRVVSLGQVQSAFRGEIVPVFSSGFGAYPLPTGMPEEQRVASYSLAVAPWFNFAALRRELDTRKATLTSQLRRVIQSRERALKDLYAAQDTARRATELQQTGELILAYGFSAPAGTSLLSVIGYDGEPRDIAVDPQLSPQENAEKWFKKARRAKNNSGEVEGQIIRIEEDLTAARGLLQNVELYETLEDIEKARTFADHHRWLHHAPVPSATKEERPYQGHRIKELRGPAGYLVLYGENAESNDYLTLRMGKPNDIWLHVRGNVSAHVLVATHNQPQRVPPEVIQFAATVSARHSPLKHSSYVPVDWTLKKYVRRPKGAPKGTVFYTHEKTIHVDPTARVPS